MNSRLMFNDRTVGAGRIVEEHRLDLELNKPGLGKVELDKLGLDKSELGHGKMEFGKKREVNTTDALEYRTCGLVVRSWTWASWEPLEHHSFPWVS